MGTYVELKRGNFNDLVSKLVKEYDIKDEDFLMSVLELFGERAGYDYFLLNNEFWEDNNSYYEISRFIDTYYGVEDSHRIIRDVMNDTNSSYNAEEVAEELGVELPEVEDDYR